MARRAAGAGTREHLTRERVVGAALAIADRDGLDGLTMRALGRELGVDPMAAYHWFPNKEAILQGVGEAVLAEIPLVPPDPGRRWQDVAVEAGRAYRAAMLAHPRAIPIVSTQPVLTPRGFALIERTLAALTSGGLAPAAGLETINTIAAFVIGSVVVEAGVTPGTEPVDRETISSAYAGVVADDFPFLTAAIGEAMRELYDDDAQFEIALDALVRGLEASFRARGIVS